MKWTERFDAFTPTQSTSWQDYDIYTNLSVPKGAVAVILVNSDTSISGSASYYGVRKDGSSLERKIRLTEACVFPVFVDADTGIIETMCESTTYSKFYLIGYWESANYTEAMNSLTITTGSWQDYDIYTNLSIPKGAICTFLAYGARKDGSSLSRGGIGVGLRNTYNVSVESSGIVELYAINSSSQPIFLGYYVDENTIYVEDATQIYSSSSTNWRSITSTAKKGTQDVMVYSSNPAGATMGLREYSSSLNRYIVPVYKTVSYNMLTSTMSNDVFYVYNNTAAPFTCYVYSLGTFYNKYEYKQAIVIGI